jgi:GNAT superfamily N-acetyltransferase
MSIDKVSSIDRVSSDETDEVGRILFESFKEIADRHGFPPEFPTIHNARGAARWLVGVEQVVSFAARGRSLEGVTFMSLLDDIAGIGPVAVDLAAQGRGAGRRLMQAAISEARDRGHPQVRLIQDAFNVTSLSLYASLGFQVVEPLAIVQTPPLQATDLPIRPADLDDRSALGALYERLTGVRRDAEITLSLQIGTVEVFERSGVTCGMVACYDDNRVNFGAAETAEDLLYLVGHRAALKGEVVQWALPMRHPGLLEAAVTARSRVVKMGNLMAIGEYEAPTAPHAVSFWY